jgi:thiamine kinase-like enzyme
MWKQLASNGSSGPYISFIQKLIFNLIWRLTSHQYSPKEIEARRPLIEYSLLAFCQIQGLVLERYPTVMAHGDLHCGNIISTSDGLIRLIDWQASCIRPLFYDLCYFVGTSVPIQV